MGMFDDLHCEYPPPLPERQGELAGRVWPEHGFQTKDFDCLGDHYRIREDGSLWQEVHTWETSRKGRPRRKPAGWQALPCFTGTVWFYDFIQGEKADYWVEWNAVFVSGKTGAVTLVKWEERDNRERLASKARWKAEAEKRDRFLATWVGRRVYPVYAWLVHGCFGFTTYRVWQWIGSRCQHVGLWLDRVGDKLAPYGDPIRDKRRHRAFEELFRDDDE